MHQCPNDGRAFVCADYSDPILGSDTNTHVLQSAYQNADQGTHSNILLNPSNSRPDTSSHKLICTHYTDSDPGTSATAYHP